jgi:hypothetical protein
MKIQSVDSRVGDIQKWIGAHGPSIRNAYLTQESSLAELEAPAGIIEKVLWRLARQVPLMELNTGTMLKALEQKKLLLEVRRQMKTAKQVQQASQGFDGSRRSWIASRVPKETPDRSKVVQDVERWVKLEIPDMTDCKSIMAATDLRLQAGTDFRPMIPPLRTEEKHLDALAKQSPGRVYQEKSGRRFIVARPGETVELGQKGLLIHSPEPPQVASTGPSMSL